jgi:hypothetical protein
MNKFSALLLVVASFFLTGCLDVVEEINLKQDGSGTYTLTMDLSQLFSDDFMKSMIMSSLQENGMEGAEGEIPKMDTVIYFGDMPENYSRSNPAFWKKVSSRIVMSEEAGEYYTAIKLDFSNPSDIAYLLEHMSELDTSGDPLGGLTGQGGFFPRGVSYTFANNTLTRTSKKVDFKDAEEGDEMMQMILAAATHKMVYNMPGSIKKTSIPNAQSNGNAVEVEASLLDMLQGNVQLDGYIKIK